MKSFVSNNAIKQSLRDHLLIFSKHYVPVSKEYPQETQGRSIWSFSYFAAMDQVLF
jgi:ferric iron reductase protein FhuF